MTSKEHCLNSSVRCACLTGKNLLMAAFRFYFEKLIEKIMKEPKKKCHSKGSIMPTAMVDGVPRRIKG